MLEAYVQQAARLGASYAARSILWGADPEAYYTLAGAQRYACDVESDVRMLNSAES